MRPPHTRDRPDGFDTLLVVVFLIGIYLEFGPKLAAGLPMPAAPAGIAGIILLLRHHNWIEERQVQALAVVIGLYLLSVLSVPDSFYLKERFKGFIQITYSLTIAYGLFVTMIRYDRRRLARIFFVFSVVIVIGCVLEKYTGFRAVSDAVRGRLFSEFLYDAWLRDQTEFGGIRPKFFTSEPSYVAYALTLYAFAWYALSTSRWKLVGYLAILGCGMYLIRSPALVLGCVLVIPYEVLLSGRSIFGRTHGSDSKIAKLIVLSIGLVAATAYMGESFFSQRLQQVTTSGDISVFFRSIGPALVAFDTFALRPLAGAGLTGADLIADRITHVYTGSSAFDPKWQLGNVQEILTNYFWHHWIYLGVGFGLLLLFGLTHFLRALHTPSVLFCWATWAVMGQASGAYVSPKPWATLLIACAVAVIHHREPVAMPQLRRRSTVRGLLPQHQRMEPRLGKQGYAG